jgi:hypothetical protein
MSKSIVAWIPSGQWSMGVVASCDLVPGTTGRAVLQPLHLTTTRTENLPDAKTAMPPMMTSEPPPAVGTILVGAVAHSNSGHRSRPSVGSGLHTPRETTVGNAQPCLSGLGVSLSISCGGTCEIIHNE